MRAAPLPLSELLQKVSRSFGLTIRWLPAGLREPVGVAYLLARISDTVADSTEAPVAQRLALLEPRAQGWSTEASASTQAQWVRALGEFAPQVRDPYEQALLGQGQACLQVLAQQSPQDQQLIAQVLSAITEGQRWDLCALDATGQGVASEQDIERYTWWVAGSVGEFWTRLCQAHLTHWHRASTAEMLQWGSHYGQGLQRLNILRDAGRDLRAGRCYFPAQSLAPLGLDAATLCAAARAQDLATLARLAPLLHTWLQQTEALLHEGLRYSLALRGLRLRLASALPGLIGVRTLAMLRQAGVQALVQPQKLPRRALRRLLVALLLGGVSDRQLRASWQAGLGPEGASPGSARIGA